MKGGNKGMSRKLRRVENNIKYIRQQIHLFLKYEYRVDYKIEVYGNKGIEREGYYSRTEFRRGRPVAIDIAYSILEKGNRENILKAGLREAIKVALWYKRVPYKETSKEYIREIMRHGLPVYGKERQVGKKLHAYGCEKCKGIYILRERKLPKSKDVTQGKYKTRCCEVGFIYMGEKHYSGEELYKISYRMGGEG